MTASKRHFGGSGNFGAGSFGSNSGYAMPYGHPVTHPGFTTIAWPGHALTTNDIKNTIPQAPKVTVKTKRQVYGAPEGYGNMMPMQQPEEQEAPYAPEQPQQEPGPEMMGPGEFPNQPEAAPAMPMQGGRFPGNNLISSFRSRLNNVGFLPYGNRVLSSTNVL